MSQSKPNEISFLEFYLTFYKLSPENMFIIGQLLAYMEHVNDPNYGKENYRDSIKFLRERAKLTVMEVCNIICEKHRYREEDFDKAKEGIRSAMKRTSRKSSYFNDILDVLNTDEFELEVLSDYYNNNKKNGDLKWLYESISDRNKHIIHYLMNDMLWLSTSSSEDIEDDFEEYEETTE